MPEPEPPKRPNPVHGLVPHQRALERQHRIEYVGKWILAGTILLLIIAFGILIGTVTFLAVRAYGWPVSITTVAAFVLATWFIKWLADRRGWWG